MSDAPNASPPVHRIGSFNLANLAEAGASFHDEAPLTHDELARKQAFIRDRLLRMDAVLVGVQEVFDRSALLPAVEGSFAAQDVHVAHDPSEASGPRRPKVGLLTRLPLTSLKVHAARPKTAFDARIGAISGLDAFRRPILEARVTWPGGRPVRVFVLHLKASRLLLDDDEDPADPVVRAAGLARAQVIRTAEAVSVRALVTAALGAGDPVIVLGDFNDSAYAPPVRIVAGLPGSEDLPDEARARLDRARLYDARDLARRQGGFTAGYSFAFGNRTETIDHVFLSHHFDGRAGAFARAVRVHYATEHLGEPTRTLSRVASDHAAVTATLEGLVESAPA